MLAWSEQSAARLLDLDDTDGRIERLRADAARLRAELGSTAAELTKARVAAATRLATEVTEELALLAMPDARLTVEVGDHDAEPEAAGALLVGKRWVRFGSAGVDEVELQLSANTGSPARPLAKGASGGELSRVMLALEVALAGTSPVPTFVFDEVDAGVAGKAAVEVGRRLAELAKTAQVLVVTHLPQVAAYADRHVVVRKSSTGAVTTSGLTVLDRGRPGARAVADVRRHGRVRHRAGPRPRAARGRPARPRPGLSDGRHAVPLPGRPLPADSMGRDEDLDPTVPAPPRGRPSRSARHRPRGPAGGHPAAPAPAG